MLRSRIVVLGITIYLVFVMMITAVVQAGEAPRTSYQPSSEKSLKYDRKMVEEAPAKSKVNASAFPYTVLSWRSIL